MPCFCAPGIISTGLKEIRGISVSAFAEVFGTRGKFAGPDPKDPLTLLSQGGPGANR